jgi:hypothetical protein
MHTSSLNGHLVWLAGAILGMQAAALPAATFYVAPDGDDHWTGRLERPNAARSDGPLASLEGARDALRRAKKETPAEPLRVVVAGGTYRIGSPCVLSPEDGGSAEHPVVYEAAAGATPVFSGGRAIEGFQATPDGTWTVRIPDVAEGKWYFEQLYVNGRRATRARDPNRFYHYVKKLTCRPIEPATGKVDPAATVGFVAHRQDVAPLAVLPKQQLDDVVVSVYHAWESSQHHIASLDPNTGVMTFTKAALWPFESGQRYHLENFKAALDAPGEWFLDRDGTLTYKPLPGETLEKADVVAPVASGLVCIAGDPKKNQWVEHLVLRGLTFSHDGFRLPPEGHIDGQSEVTAPTSIIADGAKDVVLENCRITHAAGYAIWFHQGCHNCRVQRCLLEDLGAGGVRIGAGWEGRQPCEETDHVTIDNNIIRSGGHLFPAGMAIWIGLANYNQATHNEVSDFRNSAVSVGWQWGYHETSLAHHNTIAWNHLHHLGWGVLSDMGGVYTLGRSPGTVVANNVIHDVHSYNYGGWGLYTDEGSSDIVMENNLVYRTKSAGFHQHYGRENCIRNNIFADNLETQFARTRNEPHVSFFFEQNIVYWKTGSLMGGNWSDEQTYRLDDNLYWNASGSPIRFPGNLDLAAWQAKHHQDRHSLVADPGFVDPAHDDYRLKPDSPALKLGFKPLDLGQVGVYGDPAWVQLARSVTYPPVEVPEPLPPEPRVISDDFETPRLVPALDATLQTGKRSEAIVLCEESPAGGKRCLKVEDSPDMPYPWDPHFYYRPQHREGTSRCAFDLRISPNTVLSMEWRDDGHPYLVGPALSIDHAMLRAAGKRELPLPPGAWVHVEHLGSASDSARPEARRLLRPAQRQPAVAEARLAWLLQHGHRENRLLAGQYGDHQLQSDALNSGIGPTVAI